MLTSGKIRKNLKKDNKRKNNLSLETGKDKSCYSHGDYVESSYCPFQFKNFLAHFCLMFKFYTP